MNIPDIPIRPLASFPNWGVFDIQVPYTPLKNVSSIPKRNAHNSSSNYDGLWLIEATRTYAEIGNDYKMNQL